MLRVILNKTRKQHSGKQQLYGHLPPISKTTQIRTRYAGHCWRSKDALINDALQWTPSQRRLSVGRATRTYLQLLCTEIGCSLENLLEAIDDRDEWRQRVRKIRASSTRCVLKYLELPKQEKMRTSREEKNIGSELHQTSGDERKKKLSSINGEEENFSKPNCIAEI